MGFHDAKGYWREYGEGFYDYNGDWVGPGCAFHDAKGYLRSPGDPFYDSKGNLVSPGDSFYDALGYRQSPRLDAEIKEESANFEFGMLYFVLALMPLVMFWLVTIFLTKQIQGHLFVFFGGYAVIDSVVCWLISRVKNHKGIKFAASFLGNYLCVLSYVYIVLVGIVPDMVKEGNDFSSFLNAIIVSVIAVGAIAIVQCFNYYHEIAFVEFILGILFFVIVIAILRNAVGSGDILGKLSDIYHVKNSGLFRVIFQVVK